MNAPAQDASTIYVEGSIPAPEWLRPVKAPGSYGGNVYTYDTLPEGAEPTHYVMGIRNYYTAMPVESVYAGGVVVLAVALVIIFVAIAVAFLVASSSSTMPTLGQQISTTPPTPTPSPEDLDPFNSTVGASLYGVYYSGDNAIDFRTPETCDSSGVSRWSVGRDQCVCNIPFWGPSCSRESYSSTYTATGVQGSGVSSIDRLSGSINVGRLSFTDSNSTSCTQLCDDNPECIGVLWQSGSGGGSGRCSLFKRYTVSLAPGINWYPDVESTIYLKGSNAISYTDRVFIFQGDTLSRYWLRENVVSDSRTQGSSQLTAHNGKKYQLQFFPSRRINDGGLIGVYSSRDFSESEFPSLVEGGNTDTVFVDMGGYLFDYPIRWFDRDVWVMYARL